MKGNRWILLTIYVEIYIPSFYMSAFFVVVCVCGGGVVTTIAFTRKSTFNWRKGKNKENGFCSVIYPSPLGIQYLQIVFPSVGGCCGMSGCGLGGRVVRRRCVLGQDT